MQVAVQLILGILSIVRFKSLHKTGQYIHEKLKCFLWKNLPISVTYLEKQSHHQWLPRYTEGVPKPRAKFSLTWQILSFIKQATAGNVSLGKMSNFIKKNSIRSSPTPQVVNGQIFKKLSSIWSHCLSRLCF